MDAEGPSRSPGDVFEFDGNDMECDDRPNSSKRKCALNIFPGDSRNIPKRLCNNDVDNLGAMELDDDWPLVLNDPESEEARLAFPWVDHFKLAALSALIANCELDHVRHLRRVIEPHLQKDFLALLPREISELIVSNLSAEDMIKAACVSQKWRQLCENEFLWRQKCEEMGLHRSDLMNLPQRRVLNGWQETAIGSGIPEQIHLQGAELERAVKWKSKLSGSVHQRSPWKALYLRYCKVEENWRFRPIAGSCALKGHDDHVITWLQVHGDLIVTGSDDNTLKVWSIPEAKVIHTLCGHTGGVWTSVMSEDGSIIVSGSTDRTVKVWYTYNGQMRHNLTGHTSTVRCMSLQGNILVSGSRDATLRVWDIEDGTCKAILTGHQAAVRCVEFDGSRIVSGAYDFTIKVWNASTGAVIYTLLGHSNRVYSLHMDSSRDLIVSGSLDTTIRVWNIKTGEAVCVLKGHTSLTSGMQLIGNTLVSCNADGSVRVWDLTTGECVHRLHGEKGHTAAITSLHCLDNGLVATSSDDGTVKLWDIEQGKFVRDLVKLASSGSGGCIWRIKATSTLLVCAVGSRNGTEDTKVLLVDFDAPFP